MRLFALTALLALAACKRDASSVKKPDGTKVKVISSGAAFTQADFLSPGNVVLLDFYADW